MNWARSFQTVGQVLAPAFAVSARRWQVRAPALLMVVFATTVQLANAFCPLDTRWPTGRVTMVFNFGPSGTLTNGTTSWQQNTESAMREWSDVSDAFAFVDGGFADVDQTSGDGINNMVFDDNIAGDAFATDVLAITFTRADALDNTTESDIVFNVDAAWNAYDGPVRADFTGQPVFDFRRVALHELGHVLGLDHPDEICLQTIDAIMNARTTDADSLTNDDRNGLSFIYAGGNQPPVADAGPAQTGSGIEAFVLNGGGSNDSDGFIVSYEWFLEGRLVARGRTADITLGFGTHVVTLTVVDDKGASASDTVIIVVGSTPPPPDTTNVSPVANAGADRTVVPGELVLLDGTRSFDSGGAIIEYIWSEGTAVLGRQATVLVALISGAHEITLTVFDADGASGSDSLVVIVDDAEGVSPVDEGPVIVTSGQDDALPPPPADPCGMIGWIPFLAMLAAFPLAIARRRVRSKPTYCPRSGRAVRHGHRRGSDRA